MKSLVLAGTVSLLLMIAGCDAPDRVSRLEKEKQETKAEIEKIRTARSVTADYDLQAKCSKDAKTFFTEGWSRDKDTVLLDYSNHYNKAQNKCFISVEYHSTRVRVVHGPTTFRCGMFTRMLNMDSSLRLMRSF